MKKTPIPRHVEEIVDEFPNEPILRLVLVGDSAVGKTALLTRAIDRTFTKDIGSTIGVDYRLLLTKFNGRKYKVQCWDTSGQDRFSTISRGYIRNASGILLVFDVHDPTSFANLNIWTKMIGETVYVTHAEIPFVLIGNKCDLRKLVDSNAYFVPTVEAEGWASCNEMHYFESSAKDDIGVMEAFADILERMIVYNDKNEEARRRESVESLLLDETTRRINLEAEEKKSKQLKKQKGNGNGSKCSKLWNRVLCCGTMKIY